MTTENCLPRGPRMRRSVLITGHRGFVGRHFLAAFDESWDVTGVDLRSGVDARDYFRTADERFDLVIHLAAVVGGREKIERAPLAVAVDLAIDAEMFQWALRTRPRQVVYFSSSAAYPVHLQDFVARALGYRLVEEDVDLDDVRSPDLTYGWAKLTGEVQARYVNAEGVPVLVVRPFSGYGEDQDLAYPWPSFVDRARRRLDPFPVWGNGQQVRDWIHVDDVVRATIAAVEAGVPGPVNLCSGVGTPLWALANLCASEAGYRPSFEFLTDAPSGVAYRVGDPYRMLEFYRPRISLAEAVREAVRR